MVVFDIMTIHTTLELDGFFFFLSTLTEGEVLLRGKVRSMDKSLFEELIEYAVECCLVHLT